MPEYSPTGVHDYRNSDQRQTPDFEAEYDSKRLLSKIKVANGEPSDRTPARRSSASETRTPDGEHRALRSNIPISVKEAARFLGVSPQTVYLWVERKQIPHFRVMGRNIRFLLSDLKPFRAQFKQEVENGKTA